MAEDLEFDDFMNEDEESIDFSSRTSLHSVKKDVRISCQGKVFRVHRSVLCQCSPKFHEISKYVSPNRTWQINLKNVPADMMRLLLQFVYKRSISVFLSQHVDELFPLLALSHSVEIEDAETGIFCAVLHKTASCSIISYLWDLACDYNNLQALREIVLFIHDNLARMVAQGFFRAVRWDQLHFLMAYCFCLEDRYINNLCLAIVQWLKVDGERPNTYTQSLARCLKWTKLSQKEIFDLTAKEPLFYRLLRSAIYNGIWFPPPSVRQNLVFLDKKRAFHSPLEPQRRKSASSIPTRRERPEEALASAYFQTWRRNVSVPFLLALKAECMDCAVVALGLTRNNSMAIQFFFPDKNEWTSPYETAMVYHSEAVCFSRREFLYLIGGKYSNGAVMDKCFVFDMKKLQMMRFLDLRHPRAEHGLAVYGKHMYLIGGVNYIGESLSTVLKIPLDGRFKIWRHKQPLRCKCSWPGVAVDPRGFIFVVGGCSCSCEYYEVKTEVWMELASLPNDFRNHGMHAVYHCHLIYAFRAYGPVEVCIFDPSRNDLIILRTLGSPPRDILKVLPMAKEFWVVDNDGCFFIYNVERNFWRKSQVKRKFMVKIIQIASVQQEHLEFARRFLTAV